MKSKHLGAILFIIVSSLSLAAAAASDLQFKFPGTNRKIVFNMGGVGTSDSILLIDENQKKHVIKQGVITAITISTNNQTQHDMDSKVTVRPEKILQIKKLYNCDLPLAIIDGKYFAFDSNGVIYPLPAQTNTEDWLSEFSTKEVRGGNDSSIKIIAKTKKAINGPVETQVTLIFYPEAYHVTKTIKTSRENPFFLQNLEVTAATTESGLDEITFVDSKTGESVKDSNGRPMDPILASDAREYSQDVKFKPIVSDAKKEESQETSPQLQKLIPVSDLSDAEKKKELKRIRTWLEGHVEGQPEVVDVFYNMEIRKYMYDNTRTKPEQATLMGLPGTGKDTAVHAYVDAMYNEEGAWQQNNHMFDMPVIKSEHDLWTILGSATGHVGSQTISDFINFLVRHSGGKYKITTERGDNGSDKSYVELNKDWTPGQVLEGYFAPEKAVVFVNESQHWSKQAKDQFLKKALDGIITLNNPDKGESVLMIPVTWVFATNEGEGLIAPRKANGQAATSKPLTYPQLLKNWEASHNDQTRLDEEMKKTNGLASGGKSEEAEGNSEAFINRQNNKVLLRPLSPESLQKIAAMKLETLKNKWANSYALTWNDDFVKSIQEYMYNAEKNARPMDDKVEKMVEVPLLQAVNSDTLKKGANKTLALSFKRNADNTLDLVAVGDKINLSLPIKFSEGDKLAPLKTDEELEKTVGLPKRLKKHVFGQDNVADAIGKDILVSDEASNANSTPENATQSAHNVMFLGPSSVGKTEMAKALGLEYLGSRDDVKTYDFGQVTSKEHMKEKILGSRDGFNNPIASDYMMEYDTHNGHIINVLDEAANAPSDALKAIYDVLREPVVTTFSDNRPRVMSHVWNVFTGNAGEEWYKGIPPELPYDQKMAAMQEIYANAMANSGFRRRTLEKYFSSAFIARIGESNIYFFRPMTFKSIRELSQLKLTQQLNDILEAKNRRTWDIKFGSQDDFTKTLEMIETEGFVVEEQGASIDRFVKQTFGTDLRAFLLTNKVSNQAQVTLVRAADTKSEGGRDLVNYKVLVNGQDNNLDFQIQKRVKETQPERSSEDQILTAFHEAGHELVRRILFGDRYQSLKISIIPGVAEINDHMIVYEGIAVSDKLKRFSYTKEAVLRELAVKLAGTAAQEISSRNFVHDAGKSNDIERASALAQFAILKWGLSEIWGTDAVPQDMSINDYVAGLSEAKRKLYEEALKSMLTEARVMADAVILTNMKSLIPLGTELAMQGVMLKGDLERFYEKNQANLNYQGFDELIKQPELAKIERARWADDSPKDEGRILNATLSNKIPRPISVADIDNLIALQKASEIAKIEAAEHLPIVSGGEPSVSSSLIDCGNLMSHLKLINKLN